MMSKENLPKFEEVKDLFKYFTGKEIENVNSEELMKALIKSYTSEAAYKKINNCLFKG